VYDAVLEDMRTFWSHKRFDEVRPTTLQGSASKVSSFTNPHGLAKRLGQLEVMRVAVKFGNTRKPTNEQLKGLVPDAAMCEQFKAHKGK